jgi:formiminotetrahydrofolate cyclodeaminase
MQEYSKDTLRKYLHDLAARKAAPGGGSAAALTASCGCSLICMVASFTKDNEKIRSILSRASDLKEKFIDLIDEDVIAYNKVKEAYQLSKDEGAGKRKEEIQKSLKQALQVQHNLARECVNALQIVKELLEEGSKKLITDTASSAILLEAAFNMAVYNMRINLKYIKNSKLSDEIQSWLKSYANEAGTLKEEILKGADKKL